MAFVRTRDVTAKRIFQGGGAGGVATVAQQHELTICRATGEQRVAEDDAVVHRCLAGRLELVERRSEGIAVRREWADERGHVGEPDDADRHLGGKLVEESDRRQLGGHECCALVHASRCVDQQDDLEAIGWNGGHLDLEGLTILQQRHILRIDASIGEVRSDGHVEPDLRERIEVDAADLDTTCVLGGGDPVHQQHRHHRRADQGTCAEPNDRSHHDRLDPLRLGSSEIPPKSSAGNSMP